jgi:hypothetical protein
MWDSKGGEGKHFGTHLVVSGSSGTCEGVLRLVQAKHARFQLVVLIPRAACTTTATLVMRGWRCRRRRNPHTIGLHTRHLSPAALRCDSHTPRWVQPHRTAHQLHTVRRAPGVTHGIRSGCPSPRVHAPSVCLHHPQQPFHSRALRFCRPEISTARCTTLSWAHDASHQTGVGRVRVALRARSVGWGCAMTLLASRPW